jgi:hypothetical protein
MVAVKYALDNGFGVRVINTNDRTFEDIPDLQRFEELEPTAWGSKNWFQRIVLAIYH